MALIESDQKIKQAVQSWRERKYEGSSQVTERLLEFWFKEEHILADGSRFGFWRCQREAIEAVIYIYEVCKYQSLYELARGFGVSIPVDPTKDLWSKYCFKMATGSGKTWVMALAMIWQYFNKIFGVCT
jgi:type III restriction enzyme